MPTEEINGVQVNFPFTPYPCQIDYMSKVLTCLQNNQNGVLESPTGTGKTLSLLCSSLAWQEARKAQVQLNKQAGISDVLNPASSGSADVRQVEKLASSLQNSYGSTWGSDEYLVPRIIYASRTHSQLSQAVQELKRTSYNSVKTSVIGSREQLCIHPKVEKATSNAAKVQMCRRLVTNRQCHFYNNVEEFKTKSEPRKIVGNVVDIEEIVKMGHKARACPYYLARELKSDADLVFMPYNYLLDAKSRKAHGVELQGNVIIFDEAHNLEKICEESASFDLSSLEIATAIEETTKLAEKLAELSSPEADFSQMEDSNVVPEFDLGDVIRLKKTLMDVENKVDEVDLSSSNGGKTMDGKFIFDLLSSVNITWANRREVIDVLDKITNHLSNEDGSAALNTKGAGLSKFADCLKIVFSQDPKEAVSVSSHEKQLSQTFKVHIHIKDKEFQKKNVDSWSSKANSDKQERVLGYWCFSPGHTMKELLAHGVKVIILTSGTLSPLDSFAREMQIPFPVQLENPHVIEKNQVWIGTICKGPDSAVLNSDYKNRSNESYQQSLGNTIINFARIVPNGLLVFFPSYPVMQKCVERWKMGNQWTRMIQHKPVLVEPQGKVAFNEVMNEFYEKVHDPTLNGAIFMAVCRGKVSEGLDFADINGRAVIITGLPYPPVFDPRVKLKMEYLKENKTQEGLDGWMWYRLQATRAVNQAIGRVIRHKQDYGAIILCDTRFSSNDSQKALPLWVRGQSQIYTSFGMAIKDSIKFFKEAEKFYPVSLLKSKPLPGRSENAGITSGAYFEPTFGRRSQSGGHVTIEYETASNVACHISGLYEKGEYRDPVSSQYSEKFATGTTKMGKKRSLLEALESTDNEENTDGQEQEMEDSQIPSFQPPMKRVPSKQKKIVIKTHGNFGIPNQKGKSSENSGRTEKVMQSCQSYVSEVKNVMTADGYKRFSSALATYKSERKIHTLVSVLADLFTDREEHYILFQKFYHFVRSEDKQHYAKVCQDLTGLQCVAVGKDKTSEQKLTVIKDKPRASGTQHAQTGATASDKPVKDVWNSRLHDSSGEAMHDKLDGIVDKGKASLPATPSSRCLICRKQPIESGLTHECGASACFVCWKNHVFEVSTERLCPHCGTKVRRKYLQPMDQKKAL